MRLLVALLVVTLSLGVTTLRARTASPRTDRALSTAGAAWSPSDRDRSPSGHKARRRPPPVGRTSHDLGRRNWPALAKCESEGNPRAVDASRAHFGEYQFSLTSWRAVGGRGNPIDASRREQLRRAKRLLRLQGRGAWPLCGGAL